METYKRLQYALISNDFEKLQAELNSGIDVNEKNHLGMNILHYYISKASDLIYDPKQVIELLLKHGIDIQTQTKKEKLTPLRSAVSFKHPDICNILIKLGGDFEIADENGNTPLWAAVMEYRGEEKLRTIITLLLQAGADLSKKNIHGVSPASIIIERGKSIDLGKNKKEWDLRPLMKELGIKI